MSLSLKLPSNIQSQFLKEVILNEATFRQSSSVKIIPPGIVAVVDVTETIYEDFSHDEYHFKGRISLPNDFSPCEVVVKMVFGHSQAVYSETLEDYTQEAKFYQDYLCGNKSLYGNGVPRIYGCYEAKLIWKPPKNVIPINCACIVFQYYGSSDNLSWSSGTGISDFGLKALKLLFQMHKSGMRHNSIALDTNITCLDGEPFFTDYSQACEHDCPDKEFELPTRLFDLDPDTLQCGELRDFFEELQDCVAPRRFHWYGYDIDYDGVESLDSIFQHKRRPGFAMRVPIEDQWERAVKKWKFLCANWSSYHAGEAPPVGDTSFEAYQARCDLDIIYSDDDYESFHDDEE